MTTQLELNLEQHKDPGRSTPPLERLLRIVRRSGCHTSRDEHRGRVMFRPSLARPTGIYIDLCSNLQCLNRDEGFYTSGYSGRQAA